MKTRETQDRVDGSIPSGDADGNSIGQGVGRLRWPTLVLGLSSPSTKSSYDAKRNEVTQMAATSDYLRPAGLGPITGLRTKEDPRPSPTPSGWSALVRICG